MDLGYDNGQLYTALSREPRHHPDHHHHDEHHEPGSTAGSEGGSPVTRNTHAETRCGHGGHGGSMIFHFGCTETILFEFWQTKSTDNLLLSCLIVFIMAVFYEALKCYREWLKKCEKQRLDGGANPTRHFRSAVPIPQRIDAPPPSAQQISVPLTIAAESVLQPPMAVPPIGELALSQRYPWLDLRHWFQTLLHMLQVTISFMMMLIFMTFNVYLCIAVVAGAGVGYFIFFARRENISDHCN
ncbi:GH23297 [Drosophila grimshawi]|uniref:Copper transport protein n=1 Tax=Drosophila grimshawi TaxID=7222 RepID=B4K1D7_DROGR|nr:GH23297 [Drosophila grimshawi]